MMMTFQVDQIPQLVQFIRWLHEMRKEDGVPYHAATVSMRMPVRPMKLQVTVTNRQGYVFNLN